MRKAAPSLSAILLSAILVSVILAAAALGPPQASAATAQTGTARKTRETPSAMAARIEQIASRPLLRRAILGVEVYDPATRQTLYATNASKLFNAGSTTKLLTEGTALALLGPDYRFHTRVYTTGSVTPQGTLEGDLVLVASGDPNLSGRLEPDGTLAFTDEDHSYAGPRPAGTVTGDPLHVFKELAIALVRQGIWRVHGHVWVDASLFPSGHEEPATHAVISPVVLNDNLIDVKVWPGAHPGDAASVEVDPELPYLKVINRVHTGGAETDPLLWFSNDTAEADGNHTVVLEGSVPAGGGRALASYKVQDPVLFATEAFRAALEWAHIAVDEPAEVSPAEGGRPASQRLLAEHVSPPFREEVRLTLKVSQNLHAALTPYILGAVLGHASGDSSDDALEKGFALERRFLTQAGLDPRAVSQLDGEGGIGSAYSPDFMVHYLAYMLRQPYGRLFFATLPVLGRDGTLAEMLSSSPAAGHVHAKTGTYAVRNALGDGVMLLGKGLVGMVETRGGRRLLFAAYANMLPVRDGDEVAQVGQLLAEIAEAVYLDAPPATAAATGAAPPSIVERSAAGR